MPTWGEVVTYANKDNLDELRRNFIKDLANYTNRDLIVYSSGWTHLEFDSPQFNINNQDIQGFMEAVSSLSGPKLDLILHSPGGSTEVAEQIIDYLRKIFDDIRIFVPQSAMSAATLLCCAADEVIMGKQSSLGPIDPQMLIPTETGQRYVPALSIIEQFEEVREEYKATGDIAHFAPILSQYDPGLLSQAREAVELSRELAQEWCETYMYSGDPPDVALHASARLAKYLSDRGEFKSHSRRIDRNKAARHCMKVGKLESDQNLQDFVLTIYHATTYAHSTNNATKIISNSDGKNYVTKQFPE